MRKEWLVVYNKEEVIESFRCALAAHSFVSKNKKDYFNNIEVLTVEMWEWIKEEQERKNKEKAEKEVKEGLK